MLILAGHTLTFGGFFYPTRTFPSVTEHSAVFATMSLLVIPAHKVTELKFCVILTLKQNQ